MNGVVIGTLMVLGMAPQQTDTVLPLQNAKMLSVESPGGSIVVTGWDRDEIRVQAEHSRRSFVSVRRTRGGDRLSIEAEANRGPATIVDFRLSVPRSLALDLSGTYTEITVEGVNGEVSAETTQGDVTVRGGSGSVKVSSTTGKILVDGARGSIEAETAADDIRFVNVQGDVVAESAGGDILFENAQATSVDVGTTGGRIAYEGTLVSGGTYFFGAHGGSVTVVVPEGTGASVNLATVYGSIVTNLSGQMERLKRGERHKLEVGGGGAIVEIETFAGRIALLRKGTEGALRRPEHDGANDEVWEALSASIQAGVRASLAALEEVDRAQTIRLAERFSALPATIRR